MKGLRKNKKNKGQNVAEYAILIALVVGAILAMQTFAKRGLQARVRDVTQFMVDETSSADLPPEVRWGNTAQYEPYYSESAYETTRETNEQKELVGETNFLIGSNGVSSRAVGGSQRTTYNVDAGAISNGMGF
ncbi:MAG: hypothetical protein P9M07_02085 [Candidatus Aceula meridiana]|nr:hypothetical protein [Candidatus Aceula meridiana]